jgi:very-short-patch-repair endonuclease/predicted transcriptional regulator of viral defense system
MRGERRERLGNGSVRGVVRPSAREIERLARRQQALVTRRQLLAMGMDGPTIDRRLARRRLVRVRRGIYRLGPIPQPLEPEMAAILAVGPGGVLSRQSAVFLHELLPHPARPELVHVTVTGSDRGRRPGIQLHRTSQLPPDEITRRHGIPVTTPARTILDLAPSLAARELEQALAQAHRSGLATPKALDALIARYPRRPGTPALTEILQGPRTPKLTRSRPERRLLEALRRAELPEPETNAPLGGYEVDLIWRDQRLVVEVDGHPFHSSRPDRRRDLARDARLVELGFTVLRLDADTRTERAVALIAGALGRASR